MKQTSFWEKDAFCQPYDLAIIGAGIVGLSSALFYKKQQPDARIVVLDKGKIPEGASTRNAGFACVGSITEHLADMEKESETNIKKRIKRRYNGLQLLRKTLGDAAIGYENCGGYELFTDSEKFEETADHISVFNQWMQDLIDEDQVYKAQTLNDYDVIYNRLEGALHPGLMMKALVQKVQAAGIHLRWNTKVRELGASGEVLLEDETKMQANQVLVACNGFTKRLLPEVEIKPARGFVMVSEPWPDMPWKGTFHYNRGYVYFRHINNRLLLGGGRNIQREEESRDRFGVNPKIKEYLQDFARETLHMPHLLSFEHEWSGIMGFTPTKTPVVKRLDDHRIVAAGLSGMGIAIGMDVGEKVAQILCGNAFRG